MCPWEPRRLELTEILIKAGCNPITRNSKGQTVFEVPIEREYTSVVELLLSYNVPLPPDILPIALQKCSTPQMAEPMIRNGADVHSTASDGNTVLHLAITKYAESICLDLVKRFIEAGCNPITCNSEGQTVLETAITCGYTLVVEHLLSCNVPFPPNIIEIALRQRSTPQMVKVLIRKGADVHSTASDGNTVLHLAITEHAESMCLDLVKTLIEAGCNSMAQDSDANTVLEAAMIRGYTSVAQYLLSRDITLPPTFDILYKVLQQQCSPQMIQLLARKCANDLVVMSESRWDTLLQLVHASYTGVDRQWVVEILGDARG